MLLKQNQTQSVYTEHNVNTEVPNSFNAVTAIFISHGISERPAGLLPKYVQVEHLCISYLDTGHGGKG